MSIMTRADSHRRRPSLGWLVPAAGALSILAGSLFAVALGSTWLDDDPPNAASGGREVLTNTTASGPITITSVRASAFSTTIELDLKPATTPSAEDTIAVESKAIHIEPPIALPHLDGVRRESADSIRLLLVGGPLAEGARNLTLTIDGYVIVGSTQAAQIAGPWTARASTEGSRPTAISVGPGGPLTVDVGNGLRHVIDDASYDGYILRIAYHVEGDVNGLQMLAAPPTSTDALPLPLLGPAPGQPQNIDVRLETNAESVEVLLPHLVRSVKADMQGSLARAADGTFLGTISVAGSPVTLKGVQRSADEIDLSVTSPAGTNLAFTNSAAPVALIDKTGRSYPLTHIGGKAADTSGASSVFTFTGVLLPDVDALTIRLSGYEVAVADVARATLSLR